MKSFLSPIVNLGILTTSCAAFTVAFSPTTTRTTTTATTRRATPLSSSSSSSSSTTQLQAAKKEIVILGGGFGGLNAALTLSSLLDPAFKDDDSQHEKPTITIIDKKERFVFLPLLYELCMGDADINEVAPTYESLLKDTGIQFRQASVQGIDKDDHTVYLDCSGSGTRSNTGDSNTDKNKIQYDSLIVATGAEVNLERIPGAASLALPFYSIENCLELRKRLTLLDSLSLANDIDMQKQPMEVVVVGGGYSGVELALNLSERLKQSVGKDNVKVTLVHRGKQVLEYATEHNRKMGLDRLHKSGVEIMTECSVVEVLPADTDTDTGTGTGTGHGLEELSGRARVVLQKKNSESTETQQTLKADILLWTAGAMRQNIPKSILNSELPRDSSGRLVTDKFLAVKGCDDVFALGDCSRVKKIPYGGTAAVAMQQAPFAAWNVYSSIMASMSDVNDGRTNSNDEKLKPLPFSYLDLGEMMTLGGEDATISAMGLVEVSGPAASILRRLIYAVRMPTVQQALTAAISGSSKRFEQSKSKAINNLGGTKEKGKKIINWQ